MINWIGLLCGFIAAGGASIIFAALSFEHWRWQTRPNERFFTQLRLSFFPVLGWAGMGCISLGLGGLSSTWIERVIGFILCVAAFGFCWQAHQTYRNRTN